ncbi:MAG: SGNH/GDSL hydrolase family protein [Fimbriimonadaceae bacterium]|nr:SGNH/GDSL hydrolase family protein [Fimbriimonadaceae bacterium]
MAQQPHLHHRLPRPQRPRRLLQDPRGPAVRQLPPPPPPRPERQVSARRDQRDRHRHRGRGKRSGRRPLRGRRAVLKPDVVTLDYGLNDRRIGLDRAKLAWEAMIEQAKAKGVAVILLTPSWDLGVNMASSSDPLPQHADQIRQLARKHRVALADSLEAFVQAFADGTKLESLMSQVNHPNRAGHELILKGLLPWFGA